VYVAHGQQIYCLTHVRDRPSVRGVTDPRGPERAPDQLDKVALATTADQRASNAERRAERAREHAAMANARAEKDAAAGNAESRVLHAREAELHERAADHHVAAAELQRLHAEHLRGIPS
jgi:hypothetical protein